MKNHKKTLPIIASIFFILVVLLLLGYSSTKQRVKLLERNRLEAREGGLRALVNFLDEHEDLTEIGDVQIFIAEKTLNQIMVGLSNEKAAIPGVDNAFVVIESVTADFEPGFPNLKVTAKAVKGSMEIALAIRAGFAFRIAEGPTPEAKIRIHFEEIVPDKNWFFSPGIKKFVQDLLLVNVQALTDRLPEIALPLETELLLEVPASVQVQRFPVEKGEIIGELSVPGFSLKATVKTKEVLISDEGVHLFFDLATP